MKWHTASIDTVYRELGTHAAGITTEEAGKRLAEHGANELPQEAGRSVLGIALSQIRDPIIYILLAAGVLSVFLRDFVDAAVILGVVLLNGIIGFIQESKAARAIEGLRKLLAIKAIVIRDGYEHEINAEQLVPGDILLMQSGQKVPADIRFIYTKALQIDQSMFTGESVPAKKRAEMIAEMDSDMDKRANMAFMGSNVTSGRGTGVVVGTGINTELGKISEEARTATRAKTPLEIRVSALSKYILWAVVGFGSIGFLVGAVRGENLLLLLLTLIALTVAAVPEGLPVAMTIALAVAVNRMARQNAIIRYLPAIETLGSCTVIGSDKTGTLTKNEMTVRSIWAGESVYDVEGMGYAPEGSVRNGNKTVSVLEDEALRWVLRVGLLCNESFLIEEDGRWLALGDPTETALIVAARKGGLQESDEKENYPQLDILPFESEAQYMATLNDYHGKPYLLVKGSPEVVLSVSINSLRDGEAATEKVTTAKLVKELAGKGLRMLAMAYREMPEGTKEITHADISGLTFVGAQGMLDPPRPEAAEAISGCKRSGMRVIMITGDNEFTGLSIARNLGIAGNSDTALTGNDLEGMDDTQLQKKINEVSVFARVSPHHKLRIVRALLANGEIVAVTGDGVNDAPALKAAHIGVAMGVSGTDVAKEASDMVVVDDNFASIYSAIVNGRVAFDNLRKVTYFLLASGLGALLAVMTNLFTQLPLIFLPAQILWVNLVTNGLQDVALAFDPEEPGVAGRAPRSPREGLLSHNLIVRLAIIGFIIGATSFGVFVYALQSGYSLERARTIALTTIVFAQFFNVFASRSETMSVFRQNIVSNRFLFFSMITAIIAQLLYIYWPPFQFIFKTAFLPASDWLIILGLSLLVIAGSELDKWRIRRRQSG